jgi:hypothetical protein
MTEAVGAGLGWDAEQKQAEIKRALAILADKHGVTF